MFEGEKTREQHECLCEQLKVMCQRRGLTKIIGFYFGPLKKNRIPKTDACCGPGAPATDIIKAEKSSPWTRSSTEKHFLYITKEIAQCFIMCRVYSSKGVCVFFGCLRDHSHVDTGYVDAEVMPPTMR